MPCTQHNIGRQRSSSYAVTINGLLTARGRQLQSLRLGTGKNAQSNIDAIDQVLIKVFAYEGDIAEESRDFRRVSTFKRGELRRLVADTLRKADRPMTTLEIAKIVLATKGLEASYARNVKSRVSNVAKVLQRMANVECGRDERGQAVWTRV